MDIRQFNNLYNSVKEVDVLTNDILNYEMWVWTNLTEKQTSKLYKLMVNSGAVEHDSLRKDTTKYIQLKNGMKVYQ